VLKPAGVAVLVAIGFGTWTLSSIWSQSLTLAAHMARHHPGSPRAQAFAAYVYRDAGDARRAVHHLELGIRIAPTEVGFRIDRQIQLATSTTSTGPTVTQGPSMVAYPPTVVTSEDSEEISRLLGSQPVSVHGVVALENLFTCLTQPPRPCATLGAAARDWYDTAAANPRTSATYRALILSNAAELHAAAGRFDTALAYLENATRLEPTRLHYRLQQAEYLLHHGNPSAAREALQSIAADHDRFGPQMSRHRERYERLQAELATARDRRGHDP
jgi:tetratricopeptide (TPR) repeat protein